MDAPYVGQEVGQVSKMLEALESATKSKERSKTAFKCKKSSFVLKNSRDGLSVHSWKFSDWDYKRPDLPTYARGLFTTRNKLRQPEIAVRGYDKFFNVGEVNETQWENILQKSQPPYELTLKENGCIIFVAGMEDETLLVCSKHSTGNQSNLEVSHASAGEMLLEKQLKAMGKTKADLARELYSRNVTAVAELCDDSFEEHILAYGPDKAGLYLHGMNLNIPEFTTYPGLLVHEFAEKWGFVKTGLLTMNDIQEVKTFLEGVAETGAHDGRDVEGFVIRCRMSKDPSTQPYQDWFFKYKFEEPYLMYRQWRECTKALIAGKEPRIKKHTKITEEYLLYARMRLAKDPQLAKLYNQNHGIIALREEFLAFKKIRGVDAASLKEELVSNGEDITAANVVLSPIATIGCGKTTLAVALRHLFGWGHVQNDNIGGKQRPPKFVMAIMDELKNHPVVGADRNNTAKRERKQLIADLRAKSGQYKLVCLNFQHDEDAIDAIRRLTQDRIIARGDNHQTIHAASDQNKFIGVMEGFIDRFESCSHHLFPDSGFDLIIDLDPLAGSRVNLETVVTKLHQAYPKLIRQIPSSEGFDSAIEVAMNYKPDFKQNIPDTLRTDTVKSNSQQPASKPRKLEYMAVQIPKTNVNDILENTFKGVPSDTSKFFMQLKQTRRIQPSFHVTLMHKSSAQEKPELWAQYSDLWTKGGNMRALGKCSVMLERVVFDDSLMAIVVRLDDESGQWKCVNKVAHITVGTRDNSVKPKESNDLLERWLNNGAIGGIQEMVFEKKPVLEGTVSGIASR